MNMWECILKDREGSIDSISGLGAARRMALNSYVFGGEEKRG